MSAQRFCIPNLPTIESALGVELYEGEHEEDGGEELPEEMGFMSMGRESLKEACTVVVENAINAVLLGLRERVGSVDLSCFVLPLRGRSTTTNSPVSLCILP